MKALVRINAILLLFSIIFFTNSCKKGKDGEPGKDGSANVKARTFSVATWSSNSARWYTQLSVPELTSDNINTAAVQAYYGTTSNNWVAMPNTVVASTNYFWGYATSPNIVEIRWDYNGIGIGSDPNTFYGTTIQIKVVVIPQAARIANPNINWENYNEVKEKFDLKD